jgi:hypothetical protein
MPYGNDVTVYVEDTAGDLGANPSPKPFWLSPDVDIPAHSGTAFQGTNDVQIRVHAHEEPILTTKIVAEVYVGNPSLAMSPTVGTKRIDPGNLLFRTVDVPGTEPVASVAGGVATFPWTPASSTGAVDGPGHRCLVVRAFPEDVTPPTDPFDVPNEGHEAQHNIEVLMTTMAVGHMSDGAGTPGDPRRRDEGSGHWWERLATLAGFRKGRRFIAVAFDPRPSRETLASVRHALGKSEVKGFARRPPAALGLDLGKAGSEIDPRDLLANGPLAEAGGLGQGLWKEDRLLAAAEMALSPDRLSHLLVRFDHSNIRSGTALVLHAAQWNERGQMEGGITIVLPPPR